MKIRNVRGIALEIADTGQVVEPDETVDVDDVLGASLCEQPRNWAPVAPPVTVKPATRGKSKE